MLHYHKTGFVLSRDLRSHAIRNLLLGRSGGGGDWGNRTRVFRMPRKAWGSAQQPRKFNESTLCPNAYLLEAGVINVQESPDFFCGVEEMARVLLDCEDGGELETSGGASASNRRALGTKIIHFVRNPYSMMLSNYFYHSQDPT